MRGSDKPAGLGRFAPRHGRIQRQARGLYLEWLNAIEGREKALVHPLWDEARGIFRQFALEGIPADFLTHPHVRYMMYRTGFGELEELELLYLRESDGPLRDLIFHYREPVFGAPLTDCEELGISSNALNKLYYLARISEVIDLTAERTVFELGGGYGLLCHIVQTLANQATYVLVDLPEMLALQFAFLSHASSTKLVPYFGGPLALDEHAVHLVPIHLFAETASVADLFVSTFALSETPPAVHRLVVSRKFYDADAIYLVGQNPGDEPWRQHGLARLDDVRDAARDLFPNLRLEPFPAVNAWELTAWHPEVATAADTA